jgi:hypothetical protein
MRADWDKVLEGVVYEEIELPPLTGIMPMLEEAESERDAKQDAIEQAESSSSYALESAVANATDSPREEESISMTRIAVLAGLGVAVLAGGSAVALLGFGRKE